MDPQALSDCCRALRLPADDVLALRDGADLLPALLARLILEQRRPAKPDPVADRFCRAVLDHHGARPFLASELLSEAATLSTRRPLLMAIRDLCRTDDTTPTAQQLGIALGTLAKRDPVGLHVVGNSTRAGMEWAVRG